MGGCSEGTLSRSSWRMRKPGSPRLQLSSIWVNGTNCGDSKNRRSNCTLLFYHAIACILSAFFRSTPITVMMFFIIVRAKITCSEFRYQPLFFRGTTTTCCSGYLIHNLISPCFRLSVRTNSRRNNFARGSCIWRNRSLFPRNRPIHKHIFPHTGALPG